MRFSMKGQEKCYLLIQVIIVLSINGLTYYKDDTAFIQSTFCSIVNLI